jgi:hypothetical protein
MTRAFSGLLPWASRSNNKSRRLALGLAAEEAVADDAGEGVADDAAVGFVAGGASTAAAAAVGGVAAGGGAWLTARPLRASVVRARLSICRPYP